jgi:hypothetical protein
MPPDGEAAVTHPDTGTKPVQAGAAGSGRPDRGTDPGQGLLKTPSVVDSTPATVIVSYPRTPVQSRNAPPES